MKDVIGGRQHFEQKKKKISKSNKEMCNFIKMYKNMLELKNAKSDLYTNIQNIRPLMQKLPNSV